ncbi:hypothetical protein Trco_004073 [Trichoderma cornu-damae]|uniref:F-box domain-containing protein n=1 Tax=Trichoderma cornu-damae TaxID=654480 RepID=A0A9P8QK06_9HYPO|nr:hypothetical protein Trco_004073 [Trichoderma cornu-damae]
MDQLLTNLWNRCGWFRQFTPPSAADEAPVREALPRVAPVREVLPRVAPLLDVPAEILLLIGDYLDASELLSLKLSCKSTFNLFPQTYETMDDNDKRRFLLLIEKDPLGKGTVYCHPCNRMHTFQETSGPRADLPDDSKHHNCAIHDRFSPTGNPFGLSYAHARMVMNHHLYGPGHGMPLSSLCVDQIQPWDEETIRCSTSAKVIDDELFLQRTYTFTVAGADAAEFPTYTDVRCFKVCEHTLFFPGASAFHQYILQMHRMPAAGGDGLSTFPEAFGSCGLCLMDYDIIVEPCAGKSGRVVIRAIHQLGSCRSPDDWKWARFTEFSRSYLFFPNRPNRRGSAYGPGAVRKQWVDDELEACAVLDRRPGGHLFGFFLFG